MEKEYITMIEDEVTMESQQIEVDAQRVNDGFGFGEGGISYRAKLSEAGADPIAAAESVINSDKILVPVAKNKLGHVLDDDGCGDGRAVKTVFEGEIVKGSSLNRAKVFGGATAMTTGAKIGLGEANADLTEAFADSIESLNKEGIDFGAHTDDHNAHDEASPNSGCGAIDKSPTVIANVVKYSDKIAQTIQGLGVDTSQLGDVMNNYAAYAVTIDGQAFSGKKVVEQIIDNGKIVKELAAAHNEAFVVLNTTEGHTINQAAVREATNDAVQVFGVDVWRLQDLAARLYPGDVAKANQALLGELAYTLGVSATLTAGDLPVYLVSKKEA